MTKKKRTYNHNHIRARRLYTFQELAEVFRISAGTPQRWHKNEGLQAISTSTKPYEFLGSEIIRFLKAKRQNRKHPLKPGEFFCTKCHAPRHSEPDKFSVVITEKPMGKTARQSFIKGVCEICGCRLTVFSSDQKVRKLQDAGLLPTEHKAVLFEDKDNSLNADITRGQKYENQS